jgi:hypothetical protein
MESLLPGASYTRSQTYIKRIFIADFVGRDQCIDSRRAGTQSIRLTSTILVLESLIARVTAPPAGNIFGVQVNHKGIYVVVSKLGNTFVPRKFCPMFQNPFVRANGLIRQSFGCFVVRKAGNCLAEWQRV